MTKSLRWVSFILTDGRVIYGKIEGNVTFFSAAQTMHFPVTRRKGTSKLYFLPSLLSWPPEAPVVINSSHIVMTASVAGPMITELDKIVEAELNKPSTTPPKNEGACEE